MKRSQVSLRPIDQKRIELGLLLLAGDEEGASSDDR